MFVDTSFWFAFRRRRDPNHQLAVQLLRRYRREMLATSNHVRGETWTLINRREGHRSAVAFLDALTQSPRLRILHVDEQLEGRALDWLRGRSDREFSFVDATSFVLMQCVGINEVLAFDGDFGAAGFVELR